MIFLKNKPWKRKAKRLLGYCVTNKCFDCKYYSNIVDSEGYYYGDCSAPAYLPQLSGIRAIEIELRNSKEKHKKGSSKYFI